MASPELLSELGACASVQGELLPVFSLSLSEQPSWDVNDPATVPSAKGVPLGSYLPCDEPEFVHVVSLRHGRFLSPPYDE